MTVKISISLTDQQAAYARQQVEEGRFPSTSAVIQQALEAKRREDEEYAEWKAGFFEELARRRSEPAIDAKTFRQMVDDMLDDESGKHDVGD